MSVNFTLTQKMDVNTLSHIVALRNKNGLHVDYPYGIKIDGSNDWDFRFPSPRYPGCSLRVFIYYKVSSTTGDDQGLCDGRTTSRCSMSSTCSLITPRSGPDTRLAKVSMASEYAPANNYSYVLIDGQTVNIYKKAGNWKVSGGTISIGLGRFVSIGLRIYEYEILPLVDTWVGSEGTFKINVIEKNWYTKIYTGENYLVSLHLCDEVGTGFPKTGLNQHLGFGFVLPIGSLVTVFAVFVGGTPDGKKIWIGFQQDNEEMVAQSYPDVPMKPNEEFRISANNSSDGWILETSFLGRNQITAPLLRKNREAYTDVQVSNNCYIRRILAISAAIPHQYRHN